MPNSLKLQERALSSLPPNVARPAYDREAVTNGIVHIGVGGFHRAHQAIYLDDLLARGITDWGICGIGLLPGDSRMRDALVPQDCLYTVVERSAAGEQARVIGSLRNYLLAPEAPQTALEALAAPQTRIVTLTITEGGYNFDQGTGEFIATHPDVVHDLANPRSPTPFSVFGYVVEALQRRRSANIPPFTVLSCDNLPHNGDIARRMFSAFAALRDPSLADWIDDNVTFPNCMVDRITPQTTDADRTLVRDEFGINDAWPVVCEPFRQWVIEDRFCNGRPPLEQVGVQFTSDVAPYETMKLRLLNASHSAMGYLGYLMGYRLIPDVIADPLFHNYIAALMDKEVTPLLAPVPGVDLNDYKQTLLVRFANPAIADQVSRICLDGSSKVPKFLLPSIHDALAQNLPMDLLCLAVAGWFRYLTGSDEEGNPIVIDDPLAAELQQRAQQGGSDPRPLLGLRSVFGNLSDSLTFVQHLESALQSLYTDGVHATVTRYMSQEFAGNASRVQD